VTDVEDRHGWPRERPLAARIDIAFVVDLLQFAAVI
jgi:hypothetical protein